MRRKVAVVISVLLVLSACGGGSKNNDTTPTPSTTAAKPTTTSERPETTTTTTVAEEKVALTAACPGIGPAPAGGEITWVKDGRLWAAADDGPGTRCLFETTRDTVAWGGAADRVLANDHTIVLAGGPQGIGADGDRLLSWSRPTGKALLATTVDDTLTKLPVNGDPQIGIFEAATTESAYHPAGLSIVIVVPQGDRPGLLMTSNTGENPRWIVENETATKIHDLAFTATGALLFVAEHDDMQHLHRLDLTTSEPELTIVLEAPLGERLGAVVASPWDDGRIAVGADCTGRSPLHVRVDGTEVDLRGTDVADGEPIGWLPDNSLVVLTHPDGCGPGDLYSVTGTTATLVDHDVDGSAVRAVLPPPPPPPPEIEAAPA